MPGSEEKWSKLKTSLQSMDPYEFEKLVGALWEQLGYDVTVKSASRDREIDIVAQKSDPFGRKQLLQTKRYGRENTVGSQEIRRYRTLYDQESDVDTVAIITTGEFTQDALHLSQDLDVETVDGNQLCELLQKYAPTVGHQYLTGDEDESNGDNQNEGAKYEHLISRNASEEDEPGTESAEPKPPSEEGRSENSNTVDDTPSKKHSSESRADIIGRYSELTESLDETV